MTTDMTMEQSQQDEITTAWPLRRVGLRVQDMDRCIDYYTRLGFSIVRDKREQENGSVGLGVGNREILQLRPLEGGRLRPSHTAGLYHFALLVGDETELGSFLQHCIDQHIPLDGASDHLVSQALYLSDPEGNGIEVYADRPREQWQFQGGQLRMDTIQLNAPRLLKQAQAFPGFSTRLRLGHMHLNVGALDRTSTFYRSLGMDVMISIPQQAYFLSWDGYHHHLGINLWAGRNAQPEAPDMYGLDFFEIHRAELAPMTMQDLNGVNVIAL
jgi:catechol 2,3-dioxygenase